jgi:hypothetical protein
MRKFGSGHCFEGFISTEPQLPLPATLNIPNILGFSADEHRILLFKLIEPLAVFVPDRVVTGISQFQ